MFLSGQTLTVMPMLSSQIKTYNMRVTQTTSILPAPFSWIGAVITVTCTITEIKIPDAPTETSYLIGSGDLEITMSPQFTQYPPCDYVLSEFMLWTFDPSPAPVTPNTNNMYQITINSNDLSQARQQTITLKNSITYDVLSFQPEISFGIELLHPCRRATLSDVTLADITYTLHNNTPLDTEIGIPTDTASSTYGDGHSTCGEREYSIEDSNGAVPAWVTAEVKMDNDV